MELKTGEFFIQKLVNKPLNAVFNSHQVSLEKWR